MQIIRNRKIYDVAIIGSGAGGGMAAKILCDAGADVVLLDDTWTTGASAQSACAALRLAGARSVAVIVLGRHVTAAGSSVARRALAAMPFRRWLCAVHARGGENGQ